MRIAITFLTLVLTSAAFSQDLEAKLISMPEFVISPEASAAGIDGEVKVAVSIDREGNVDRAVSYSGPLWPCGKNPRREIEEVREGVRKAAEQAKFTPRMKDGRPQGSEVLITVLVGESYERHKKRQASPANNGDSKPEMISGGVINGKALRLPKPEYPMDAHANRAAGAVAVKLVLDEQGKVILAGALSGHPLLHDAARDAACRAKFSRTLLSGQPIKVTGVLIYNFVP